MDNTKLAWFPLAWKGHEKSENWNGQVSLLEVRENIRHLIVDVKSSDITVLLQYLTVECHYLISRLKYFTKWQWIRVAVTMEVTTILSQNFVVNNHRMSHELVMEKSGNFSFTAAWEPQLVLFVLTHGKCAVGSEHCSGDVSWAVATSTVASCLLLCHTERMPTNVIGVHIEWNG